MKNVIIINSVMVNNGDAGLVINLAKKLGDLHFNVTVATYNYRFSKSTYRDFAFCKDVVSSVFLGPKKVLASFMIPLLMLLNRKYRRSDLVIGAPGGYINSYYGFRWKLYVFKWAKLFGKKTVLYSQSIGPLTEKDKLVLQYFSKYIDLIVVRDQLSYKTAIESGVVESKLMLSEDAIFLQKPSQYSYSNNAAKKACISVRSWQHDGRSEEHYFGMITSFVKLLLKRGYVIDFLSTCQGVHGYIDDSVVATEIVNSMDESVRKKITVISDYYNLFDVQIKIREYDLVVGTRLHMCLLSLLNGVPAFNVSYEAKGKECYKYLHAEEFTVDYNDNVENATAKLDQLLSGSGLPLKFSPKVLNEKNRKSVHDLSKILSYVHID